MKDVFNLLSLPQKLLSAALLLAVIAVAVWVAVDRHDKNVIKVHEAEIVIAVDKKVKKDEVTIKKQFESDNPSINAAVSELLPNRESEAGLQSAESNTASTDNNRERNTYLDIPSGLRNPKANRQENNRRRLQLDCDFDLKKTDGLYECRDGKWKRSY